ncbi:Deoxyribodipyrimidine photo-lyase [Acorus calamus]|uniref:Deoxyribodipyrimidine photo-lyase n=1 Tax=Acorus calamus TaxID=4465 RepID=A0AAV9DYT5_ACOCL|nr:Deoxyribodipyrimidine photo-lyase [Acorus calamus]
MSRLTTPSVQVGRIRVLKEANPSPPSISGPVVYWMFRDERSSDNWALIHAVDLANRSGAPVAVLFNLFHRFLGAHARQLGFMVRGLRELRRNLDSMGIPFFLLRILDHLIGWTGRIATEIDWEGLIAEVSREGADVPEVDWCEPGETAAREVLLGSKNGFLTKRLKNYYNERNDPLKTKSLSGLSPYLQFGQISTQHCALEARAFRKACTQPQYDSLQGAWVWARKTLMDHALDKREHIYTKEQLEQAKTADPLWNASQLEMVHMGKMHGFMRQAWIGYFNPTSLSRHQYWIGSLLLFLPIRPLFCTPSGMYWAKKILEWTKGPEEALSIAIYLNDKYEIDGRDPNGYVGCMWSVCGVHDQGWKERPVFGRYQEEEAREHHESNSERSKNI